MQLPAKLSGLERKIEMMRSGVNFARVFNGRYDERTWRKRTRRVDLVMPLLDLQFEPWQLEDPLPQRDAVMLAIPRVSRLLRGKRLITLAQLIKLAHHFGLVGIVGNEHEAAALLCDDVTADEFERRLVQSGWRQASFRHAPYTSRLQILDEFGRVAPLTRSGLEMRTVTIDGEGYRGVAIPEEDGPLPEFPLDARIRFAIHVKKPVGLMMFEIQPSFGTGQRYHVTCLAPSVMAPAAIEPARGGALVPLPRPGDPRDSFVLSYPHGRHDVVAVLSDPPIEVPWIAEPDRLYEPTAAELTSLLDGIAEAGKTRRQAVEIRHFPYRIVIGARA